MLIGGTAWVFVVSSHKVSDEIVGASISENGELTMLPCTLSDMTFVTRMTQELTCQGKL